MGDLSRAECRYNMTPSSWDSTAHEGAEPMCDRCGDVPGAGVEWDSWEYGEYDWDADVQRAACPECFVAEEGCTIEEHRAYRKTRDAELLAKRHEEIRTGTSTMTESERREFLGY